jgi:hypothetical protein
MQRQDLVEILTKLSGAALQDLYTFQAKVPTVTKPPMPYLPKIHDCLAQLEDSTPVSKESI